MINEKFLREIITEQIDNGKSHFIIFPFGTNGINIKKCLEECFMIEPEMLVDNKYSKYNPNIVDFNYLKEKYQSEMTILLSIEDITLNSELEKRLLSFVDRNQIINLGRIYEEEKQKIREKIEKEKEKEKERMKLENENLVKRNAEMEAYERNPFGKFSLERFLPQSKLRCVRTHHNIKIRFFHSDYYFWNSIKTICSSFKNDNKYDVLIIVNKEKEAEQMEMEHYSFVTLAEYDIKEDKPDILVVSNVWDRNEIRNCRKYTSLIIAVPSIMIRHAYSIDGFWNLIRMGFERFCPDYYLFDSLLYEEIKESKYYFNGIIEMGSAKFDGIYMTSLEKEYPEEWKKLKGKKVILWACDHGILEDKITDYVTFDIYAKGIFDYIKEQPEVGIIMRFHRLFVEEMIENHCWSQKDIKTLREYCSVAPNLVWDENNSYDVAYSIADAVLTDALSGIIYSALPRLKPICMLFRNRKVKLFHPQFSDVCYSAFNPAELKVFFDMIVNDEDPKFQMRSQMNKKYIKYFDGKNGERIKSFIENVYFDIKD